MVRKVQEEPEEVEPGLVGLQEQQTQLQQRAVSSAFRAANYELVRVAVRDHLVSWHAPSRET
jgi:hypothetical protein